MDGRALGRQVEVGVQSSRSYWENEAEGCLKIGYADLNGGIDEREVRARPGKSRVRHSVLT